jgi:hypothetical protein
MTVPSLEFLQRISPVVGESSARKGRNATLVRERLGEACSLKPFLWTPRIVHRTPVEKLDNDYPSKVVLSIYNGSIVGQQCLMPPKGKPRKFVPWIYTRYKAPFTGCNERVSLFQRVLRHLASLGVKSENYKILKRILTVGFQIPMKHLRKMVRKVVLSCHNSCCKSNSQPLVSLKRAYQYPSLSGETKTIRKYGVTVPLWDRTSGFTTRSSDSCKGSLSVA